MWSMERALLVADDRFSSHQAGFLHGFKKP